MTMISGLLVCIYMCTCTQELIYIIHEQIEVRHKKTVDDTSTVVLEFVCTVSVYHMAHTVIGFVGNLGIKFIYGGHTLDWRFKKK